MGIQKKEAEREIEREREGETERSGSDVRPCLSEQVYNKDSMSHDLAIEPVTTFALQGCFRTHQCLLLLREAWGTRAA